MSQPKDDRWRETADAETRRQHADGYWCVRDDGVQYFWHELTVTREEALLRLGRALRSEKGAASASLPS